MQLDTVRLVLDYLCVAGLLPDDVKEHRCLAVTCTCGKVHRGECKRSFDDASEVGGQRHLQSIR